MKFNTKVVNEVPASSTKRESVYDGLIAQVPDAPKTLEVAFDSTKEAKLRAGGVRGYLKRRSLSDAFKVSQVGQNLYISKEE